MVQLTVVVHILGVPPDCDRSPSIDTIVNPIHSPKRISDCLMIRQHALRTRLESCLITSSIRIKRLQTRQYRVYILPTPRSINIHIGDDVLSIPILLQKT